MRKAIFSSYWLGDIAARRGPMILLAVLLLLFFVLALTGVMSPAPHLVREYRIQSPEAAAHSLTTSTEVIGLGTRSSR